MALTATVTKKSVTNPQPKLYIITFNLTVTNGGSAVVINQDFTTEYRTGEAVSGRVNDVKAKMQEVIDAYKASQAIFTNAALDTAVTSIQSGLTL
jgi:hypothetical protein